jgi:hypothetical protein
MKFKKKLLSLISLLAVTYPVFGQTFPNSNWKYSVPLTFASGTSINSTVKVDVNFTQLLSALGVSGTLDVNSIRVVKPNGTLVFIQEFNDNIFGGTEDANNNGRGQIAFILEDAVTTGYRVFFDTTTNGTKEKNPQTPINGGFEKGISGQSLTPGWNAPVLPTGYDAQVRPSENPTITTVTDGTPLSRTTNGTPFSGSYSYLMGDRTDSSTSGVANGSVKLTKTIQIPASNPGNLVFKYRIEGWDSTGFDYFEAQIVDGTTITNIVGPTTNNYPNYPYSPNYGSSAFSNASSGYGQYNGWDYSGRGVHVPQNGNTAMVLTRNSEPWFTVSYPLTAFSGKKITLTFSTTHVKNYKTWVSIDDVEWSVVNATVGSPTKTEWLEASNFDCLETGLNYNKGTRNPLYTKITNSPFSFDIVALDQNGDIKTNYASDINRTVEVEIFDNSNPKSCSTYSNPIASTTATFTTNSKGRVTIPNLTTTSAYPKLICRVKDSNYTVPVQGCSSDNFSIRPQNINNITSNANADSSGLNENALPKIIAGSNFTITANTNTPGYNGVPKVNNNSIEWLNAPEYGISKTTGNGAGILSGSFINNASSTNGNNANGNFTYSEAGYFRFKTQGIYDDSFISASSDNTNGDCIINSFSNVLNNGKYGCNFGTTNVTSYMGRFIPAAFVVTANNIVNRSNLTCSNINNFTYLGEPFDIGVSLKPVNALGNTVLNYSRTKLSNIPFANWNLNISNNLNSRLNTNNYVNNWSSNGIFNAVITANISRTSLPNGPFNNTVISFNPKDYDGVSLLPNVLDFDTNSDSILDSKIIGSTNFYFGRMKIKNTIGSEILKQVIPLEVQYYNGAGFITNNYDNCTNLKASNFSTNNFTQNLTSDEISLAYPSLFINGKQSVIMNKPSNGDGIYNGSFDLNYNLTTDNKVYLLDNLGNTGYNSQPKGKIILGKKQNKSKVIFIKDNF